MRLSLRIAKQQPDKITNKNPLNPIPAHASNSAAGVTLGTSVRVEIFVFRAVVGPG